MFESPRQTWNIVTDQEVINLISNTHQSIFGLTNDGQIIIYPKDGSPAFEDAVRLEVSDYLSLSVEEVKIDEQIHLKSIDTDLSNASVISNVAEDNKPVRKKDTSNTQGSLLEQQSSKRPKRRDQSIKALEQEVERNEEVLEINLEEVMPSTRTSIDIKKIQASVKYVVYVGSGVGLFARVMTFSKQWSLVDQSPWVHVHNRPTAYLLKRKQGGYWWGGVNGFGMVIHGVVKSVLGGERIKLMTSGQDGLFISTLSDEVIAVDSEGKKTELSTKCSGPVLAMSAHSIDHQLLIFCGDGKHSVHLRKSGTWYTFKGQIPTPRSAQIRSLNNGWIYRSKNQWLSLRFHQPSMESDRSKYIIFGTARELKTVGDHQEQHSLWYTPLKLAVQFDHSKLSAWQAYTEASSSKIVSETSDNFIISERYRGLKLFKHFIDKKETLTYLRTGNLSAQNTHRPFMMTAQGELFTTTQKGALVGDGSTWKTLTPPEGSGRVLGLVECMGTFLWVTSHRKDDPLDLSAARSPYKLSLEIWDHQTKEPKGIIDWSAQSYRQGDPSLGDIQCSSDGKLYTNLFWGLVPRQTGVGLLIINVEQEKVLIWKRRLGYDGEEEVTSQPLLPDSVFNAIKLDQDRALYIATNSGLILVDLSTKDQDQPLLIYDEANGWPIELFNDLSLELTPDQQVMNIWLATPKGLLRMTKDKPKLNLKGHITALSYNQFRQELWIGLHKHLWIGSGTEKKAWRKVDLSYAPQIDSIIHIFPTPSGGAWLVSTKGVFFNPKVISKH